MEKVYLSTNDILGRAVILCDRQRIRQHDSVWGVPRGGVPAAFAVQAAAKCFMALTAESATIIIDDLIDSGATRARFGSHVRFDALYNKGTELHLKNRWLVFPWEEKPGGGGDQSAEDIFVRLLQFIGEDPSSERLKETPARAAKAWKEWAAGYGQKPADILKLFDEGGKLDEMVVVKDIPIMSTCEHHLSPIIGKAAFGYVPGPSGKIVGLSKIPRLFDVYARRLQLQERLTRQVGDAFMSIVEPLGVGVIIEAEHMCMASRGVRIHGAKTVTSNLQGVFKTDARARAEFMELCK